MLDVDKRIHDAVRELGGMYIRYSDDFMIILPDSPEIDATKELTQISNIMKQAPRLELEPNKTQYFYYANGVLTNCGKPSTKKRTSAIKQLTSLASHLMVLRSELGQKLSRNTIIACIGKPTTLLK